MGASQSARTETEEDKKIHRRNFRRKSVGGSTLQFIEQHPAVDIASRLTIALERATLRAERAEAEVLRKTKFNAPSVSRSFLQIEENDYIMRTKVFSCCSADMSFIDAAFNLT